MPFGSLNVRVLGIHDGHTATACYLEDGRLLDALSEERLTQVKGQGGFPALSISHILESRALKGGDVDRIALVGYLKPLTSIAQYRSGRQRYFPFLVKLYPGDVRKLIMRYVRWGKARRLKNAALVDSLCRFGLSLDRIDLVEHHQAHAATAYYLSSFAQGGKKTLVVTLDGSGDGLCGIVSVVDERGSWTRLKDISTFDSLGMLYSRVTQYLGMKPWEHEYKLMGMAPYVSEERARKVRDVFAGYLRLSQDGLGLANCSRLWGNSMLDRMYCDLRGERFDSVAAGAQLLHEELVVALVRNWLRKTGIGCLAVAGGCFMNVKANKLLMELPECKEIFVMPSCGDESCAIGGAIWAYLHAKGQAQPQVPPLGDLYFGPQYTSQQVSDAIAGFGARIRFRRSEDVEAESARLLAEHKIIGRLSGRMEWGARALGNRSILANPSRLQSIRRLNAAIKMRDFWMPFAPSILFERRREYAVMPTEFASFHMTMAYDSTPAAREHLVAALHPYDFTMRPQFVTAEHNPKYHRLLSEFEKLTGIGGVLNTSFNLHGWPIICSPKDAINTLLNSALDCVTLEDYVVQRASD